MMLTSRIVDKRQSKLARRFFSLEIFKQSEVDVIDKWGWVVSHINYIKLALWKYYKLCISFYFLPHILKTLSYLFQKSYLAAGQRAWPAGRVASLILIRAS